MYVTAREPWASCGVMFLVPPQEHPYLVRLLEGDETIEKASLICVRVRTMDSYR